MLTEEELRALSLDDIRELAGSLGLSPQYSAPVIVNEILMFQGKIAAHAEKFSGKPAEYDRLFQELHTIKQDLKQCKADYTKLNREFSLLRDGDIRVSLEALRVLRPVDLVQLTDDALKCIGVALDVPTKKISRQVLLRQIARALKLKGLDQRDTMALDSNAAMRKMGLC